MDPITALLALAGITIGPRLMILFGLVRNVAGAASAGMALRDAFQMARTLNRFRDQMTPEERALQGRYFDLPPGQHGPPH